MTHRITGALAAVALALGVSTTVAPSVAEAQAQQTKCVSAKTDWSVCVWENPKECWAVSAPKESANSKGGKPVQVRRGDTMLFVAYRPGQGGRGEVSYTPGYGYARGAQVKVDVGSDKFTLFTDGEWAWPANANDDAALLAALRRGSTATISGSSARGTDTKDTFSLRGLTAAMQEAEARCK